MSRSNIHVRFATIDEVRSIAAVLFDAFIAYKPLYTTEAFAATTPSAVEIKLRFDEGPTWVAILDNRIVGTVAVMATDNALYIRSMAVLPNARTRGIGKILLEQIESHAKANGFKRMFLYTTLFLNDAIKLYERFGFVQTGELQDLKGTPLMMMEKELIG